MPYKHACTVAYMHTCIQSHEYLEACRILIAMLQSGIGYCVLVVLMIAIVCDSNSHYLGPCVFSEDISEAPSLTPRAETIAETSAEQRPVCSEIDRVTPPGLLEVPLLSRPGLPPSFLHIALRERRSALPICIRSLAIAAVRGAGNPLK